MMKILRVAGLRFSDAADETAFYENFVLHNLRFTQAAMILGGLFYYLFFIWDRIIDSYHSYATQALRGGVVVPIILLCTAAVSFKALRSYVEALEIIAITAAGVGLSAVYFILKHGFDFGAVGPILMFLFAFTLLPARSYYYLAMCVLIWGCFDAVEVISDNAHKGMFLINNMSVGMAACLGMFSAIARERSSRLQFLENRELNAARNRVDELLNSMLPADIVKRIQAGETAIADAYGEVSIVFADLVGFTELSRKVSPGHLVELLNELFSEFDILVDKFGVEKIKTIGDAYMAAVGISRWDPKNDHAKCAAEFACALLATVKAFSDRLGYPVNLRIGLHIGSVVAGVIGIKRPAFDCWGEAVNLASRLEHSATPGGILISESAYWRLRKLYRIDVLADVNLAGIGPSKVFLLHPNPASFIAHSDSIRREII